MFHEYISRIIIESNVIHKGELYSPLQFSDAVIIESIDTNNGDRATATLCHHMDICEVVTIVSIAKVELTGGKFVHCISTELHEAKTTWFLVQGSCFDDSEQTHLIINDKEEFYQLHKFDRFEESQIYSEYNNIMPFFVMSKRDPIVSDSTVRSKPPNDLSLEAILTRSWTNFSKIDKMLIIKAIGVHLKHNY